jgi:hypothetical protein
MSYIDEPVHITSFAGEAKIFPSHGKLLSAVDKIGLEVFDVRTSSH